MYGDKTANKYLFTTGKQGKTYKKLNLEYFITKQQFHSMYYDNNKSCEDIYRLVNYERSLRTFIRQVTDAGWKRRKETFHSDGNFFKDINKSSAWALGWIITDGHMSETFIKIDLQKRDVDVLKKLKRLINFEGNIYESKLAKGIKIYNKDIIKDLTKIGIPTSNKTFDCTFPDVKGYEWDFIRGCFEGDGSVSVSKGHLSTSFCGASEFFMSAFNDFLNKNGINTRVETRENGFKVIYGKRQSDSLRWLYLMYNGTDRGIRMDRKFNKYVSFVKTFYDYRRTIPEAIALVELARKNIPECSEDSCAPFLVPKRKAA